MTAAGLTAEKTWAAFSQTDKSFICAVPFGEGNYHTTEYAGKVIDFDVFKYRAKKEVRRSDDFARFGTATGIQAMVNSGRLVVEKEPTQDVRGVYKLTETDPEGLAVVFGVAAGGTKAVEHVKDLLVANGPDALDMYYVPRINPARVATDIAKMIHAKGGAFTINSACASGAQAVLEAYRMIKHGYANTVVAGGTESPLHPTVIWAFRKLGVLANFDKNLPPSEASRPFNTDPKGLVLAEGSAALVLERLSDVLNRQDNTNIIAEIAGGHYFADPEDELIPKVGNIAKLVGTALESAGVKPEEIDHSSNHAAGSKGDVRELEAQREIFGDRVATISFNAPKSRVGHPLGAAGAIESLITAKEVSTGLVTATANLTQPVLEGFHIVTTAEKRSIRNAIKISLGLDGQFCCLVFKKFEY